VKVQELSGEDVGRMVQVHTEDFAIRGQMNGVKHDGQHTFIEIIVSGEVLKFAALYGSDCSVSG
jgi:hypothetical protein